MSIRVNDFQWEAGKNDDEYIKLLESSRDEWQKIAQKAIAKLTKLKTLSRAQEPRVMTVEDFENNPNVDSSGCLAGWTEYRRDGEYGEYWEDTDDEWAVIRKENIGPYESNRTWTSKPTPEQMRATPWD